ncbi:hypothetical protein [Nocardia asiatica]
MTDLVARDFARCATLGAEHAPPRFPERTPALLDEIRLPRR